MRGRRVTPKTNAEGEIDENFWAQAAAGTSGEDGNESEFLHPEFYEYRIYPYSHLQMAMTSQYHSTRNSSTMTLMMAMGPGLTMETKAVGSVPPPWQTGTSQT